mmetsp:Transcript_66899/g.193302  ORF Transcript_66899/g.193302 Transcript_66899/m.193302 type:complete len:201 (-) Transcript_66899:1235-1837(-)
MHHDARISGPDGCGEGAAGGVAHQGLAKAHDELDEGVLGVGVGHRRPRVDDERVSRERHRLGQNRQHQRILRNAHLLPARHCPVGPLRGPDALQRPLPVGAGRQRRAHGRQLTNHGVLQGFGKRELVDDVSPHLRPVPVLDQVFQLLAEVLVHRIGEDLLEHSEGHRRAGRNGVRPARGVQLRQVEALAAEALAVLGELG